jgi:hypothetical protein
MIDMSFLDGPEGEIPPRERPIPEIMCLLQESLGHTVIAYAIGDDDLERLEPLTKGEVLPSEEAESTLRDLAEITDILAKKGITGDMVQTVMFGMNQAFDNEAPITLIRRGQSAKVAAAASGFTEGYS